MKVLNGSYEWDHFIAPLPPEVVQSEPFGDDSRVFAAGAGPESKGLPILLFIECAVAN